MGQNAVFSPAHPQRHLIGVEVAFKDWLGVEVALAKLRGVGMGR